MQAGRRKLSWDTAGPPGADGQNGANGANGINGLNGVNGTTGFTSRLPSGKTEQGVYSATRTGASELPAWTPVSFVIPLAAPLPAASVSFIAPDGGPTPECPGSASNPQAASGHLCIYEAANFNTSGPLVFNPDTEKGEGGTGPYGFVVRFSPTNKENDWGGFGTWAVTG